tara:strand:- start:411 stop:1379 length:969 start_codon:yes stop_codon:yes gene_type:complete
MAKRGTIAAYSRRKLEEIIAEIGTGSAAAAGSDNQIQFNNGGSFGAVAALTWDDSDLKVSDDTKIIFGTNSDAFIEYREASDNFLVISGSSNGIVLSGSTIQIRGTLEGASPLRIAGGIEIVPSDNGEDTTAMKFGDDIQTSWGDSGPDDSFLQWKATGVSAGYMIISGSTNGIILSGSAVKIDKKLGIGIAGNNITHAITLPDNADATGKIKANAYLTYSSIKFKENIEVIDNPLDIIENLRGVTFSWKKNKEKDYGFIAEEVGMQLPNIVEWDSESSQKKPKALSMDYTRIIPILLEGIKSQQQQIDTLKTEIKALKTGD